MNKIVAYCSLIGFFVIMSVMSMTCPQVLSDKNSFLKGFVTHELLGILSVVVSITLASTSALHLEFNKIEERHGTAGFVKARAGVRQAAHFLLLLLAAAIVLVVAKAATPLTDKGQAFINGLALFILFWNVLILISITRAVFAIKPNLPD